MDQSLESHYIDKMQAWSDERLAFELTCNLDPDGDWAAKEVREAWVKCIRAEQARRGY